MRNNDQTFKLKIEGHARTINIEKRFESQAQAVSFGHKIAMKAFGDLGYSVSCSEQKAWSFEPHK